MTAADELPLYAAPTDDPRREGMTAAGECPCTRYPNDDPRREPSDLSRQSATTSIGQRS
jgi:hypothetical protein